MHIPAADPDTLKVLCGDCGQRVCCMINQDS